MKWRTKRAIARVIVYSLCFVLILILHLSTETQAHPVIGWVLVIFSYRLIEWGLFEPKHEPREEIDEKNTIELIVNMLAVVGLVVFF